MDALLCHLEDHRFVAVVGSSGSGKSSLVRAGLLPAVRGGFLLEIRDWITPVVRPGYKPFERLARALVRAASDRRKLPGSQSNETLHEDVDRGLTVSTLRRESQGLEDALRELGLDTRTHLVLVVDQFEEIFAFRRRASTSDQTVARDEAAAFVSLLLNACSSPTGRIWVVLTMRSDFIGDCEAFLGLPEAVSRSQFLVPRLDRSQMERAITGPSLLTETRYNPFVFEHGLVNQLINDAGDRPDQLPLMQHALMRTWRHAIDRSEADSSGCVLASRDYNSTGGLEKVLSDHANEAWAEIKGNPKLAEVARDVFLLLCDVSPDGQIARRRPSVGEIMRVAGAGCADVERVVRAFQNDDRNFLITSPAEGFTEETRLDISHESLLRQWDKLSGVDGWLEKERGSVAEIRRLVTGAKLFNEGKGESLSAKDLDRVKKWQAEEDPDLEWALRYVTAEEWTAAMQFVDASVKAMAHRDRVRRRVIAACMMAVLVVVTLLVINVWQAYKSLARTRMALRMAYLERGMRLLDAGDPAGGAVWFAQLFKLMPPHRIKTDVYRRRLEIGLRQLPRLLQLLPHDRQALYSEMSRDGRHIVTLTAAEERTVEPDPSDSRWATGTETAWLWTIKDAKPAQPHRLESKLPAKSVCLSPDGSLVASAHGDDKGAGEILIWNITGAEPNCIRQLSLDGAATLVAWSPDGARVAFAQEVGTAHGKVSVWDWKSEKQPGKSSGQYDKIALLVWSPAGNAIAFVDQQKGEARVWDLASSTPAPIPLRLETSVNDVVFSSDGRHILTAAGIKGIEIGAEQTEIGRAQIWNAETGERFGPWLPHKGAVLTAQFSPDNKFIVTASTDGTAKVWSASSGRELLALPHDGWVFCASFSPDGRHIATGGRDRMAHVWDILTGQLAIPPMNHGGTVSKVAFSSDGRRLITTSKETPRIWAFATGIKPPPALKVDGPISWGAFSRNGRRIVTIAELDSGKNWKAQIWDAKSGHLESEYQHAEPLTRAALSDDGSRVLLGVSDVDKDLYRALVLDASNGKPVSPPISLAGDPAFLAFGQGKANQFVTLIRDDKGDTTIAQVWNAPSGEPLTKPLSHEVPVYFATFSLDNSRLLTTGGERNPNAGKAFIWQVMNNDQRPIVVEHSELVTHGEFSTDGRKIVTASEDNYASVWQTADGMLLSTLKNLHTADLTDVSFSPDGNQIVSASYDQTAVVSDWRKREIVSVFKHSGVVNSAQFSPDGKRVATASADCTARLWDVKTNELIAVLKQGDSVRKAAFSENGRALLAFSAPTAPSASFQKGISGLVCC